ncbi:hypothetical protein POTOM_026163 [Populus tomentosa]|uniref:Protein kinase domain-containing protein n=1 Tax=Populus tomentosa TaxID=118781 RepID=A0A8X8CZ73_POPTO|nr:hypothetical protein POTOM_026163 [Populus tomentosa]
MIVAGSSQKKKASTLFSPWQSPVENSPGKNEISTIKTTNSGGCSRRLNDCMILPQEILERTELKEENLRPQPNRILSLQTSIGFYIKFLEFLDWTKLVSLATVPSSRPTRPNLLYVALRILVSILKVADLEREVLEQKELRIMYRKRMETTQDYLKYCLQVAQENGFLDLIIQNKDDQQVKCMFPDFFLSNENGVNFFAQELDTLSRQRHCYVLQLLEACIDPPGFCGIGVSQAMQYLHQQKPKVIHRDLKPSNIFLDDSNHVRVADFGHARFLLDDAEMALTGETGTYVYMAPEVIRCEPYNEKSDVYSFAVILNELMTGDYPYIETDFGPSKIAMEVAEGKLRPMLPHEDNDQLGELIDLIPQSWDHDASVRPSFATITSSLRKIQQRIIEGA